MIAAQRRAVILEIVRKEGAESITTLSERVGASASTVRRDLEYLTRAGYIVRSHGGAIANDRPLTTFEPEHEIGSRTAHEAKAAIGLRAATFLEPGQSVIFDSSSTVLEAAKAAVQREIRLIACTNDIATATVLARSRAAQLVVLGGTLRPGSLTLIGDPGFSFLDRLHVDVALVGIHALVDGRLSETSIEVTAMKRRMIGSAARSIVLADSSKFRHPAFCDVCAVSDVQTVITDAGLSAGQREALVKSGVEVIVAEPE